MTRPRRSTPKSTPEPLPEPIGPLLATALAHAGYAERVIRLADVATLIRQKTGRSVSRQRVAQWLNAVRLNRETVTLLAQALGMSLEDLIRLGQRNS